MFGDEKTVERGEIAYAYRKPEGTTTKLLNVNDLYPIGKIIEPVFYEFVKKSVQEHGLYHPLVVRPVTYEEWDKELKTPDAVLPPEGEGEGPFLRVQCGCNRLYALKELGYTLVECIEVEEKEHAENLCHVMRIDKRWQRGSSWEEMHGK